MQSRDRLRHARVWKWLAFILPALLLLSIWLQPSPVERPSQKLSLLEMRP